MNNSFIDLNRKITKYNEVALKKIFKKGLISFNITELKSHRITGFRVWGFRVLGFRALGILGFIISGYKDLGI